MRALNCAVQIDGIDLLILAGDAVGVRLSADRPHRTEPTGMGYDELQLQLFAKLGPLIRSVRAWRVPPRGNPLASRG